MQITRSVVDEAIAKGLLTQDQGVALWFFLAERESETPAFKPAHILYYLGGMIAIGAMTLLAAGRAKSRYTSGDVIRKISCPLS
jgi:hypothetical protein